MLPGVNQDFLHLRRKSQYMANHSRFNELWSCTDYAYDPQSMPHMKIQVSVAIGGLFVECKWSNNAATLGAMSRNAKMKTVCGCRARTTANNFSARRHILVFRGKFSTGSHNNESATIATGRSLKQKLVGCDAYSRSRRRLARRLLELHNDKKSSSTER
jgi:hypothetical protein